MTHGKKEGKIFGADREFKVEGLWKKFIGDNCPSLVGKPKLFFIQACRGNLCDPGVLCFEKKVSHSESIKNFMQSSSVTEQANEMLKSDTSFVIPTLTDVLVMYSTAEGYFSFRNPADGSWFIQALCEELRESDHDDLMTILTGVNRRVAFAKQSKVPHDDELDAMKQMPSIVSMLTKNMYFEKKSMKTEIEYA
jgi:caspase 7